MAKLVNAAVCKTAMRRFDPGLRLMNSYKTILGICALIALIVIVSFFVPIDMAQEYVARAGIWGPLVLIALKATTIVAAPISGGPLYPVAGLLFGPVFGVIYIVIGDLIGSVISFYISRIYGRKIVNALLDARSEHYVDAVLSYMEDFRGFIIARIIFSPLPEVVSYAAGLTKIKFRSFVIIHNLIGLIPTIALVGFGATVDIIKHPLALTVVVIIGTLVALGATYLFLHIVRPKLAQKAEYPSKETDK